MRAGAQGAPPQSTGQGGAATLMKYLQILNAVFAALGATFMVTLGVVAIMYAFYLDAYPRLRGDFEVVLQLTAIFAIAFAVSGLTTLAVHRRWRGWWIWQLANFPVLGVVALVVAAIVGV